MSESEHEVQHSSLNLNDVLFILFKHKCKIFLCAAAGIVAAAAVYLLLPPIYESEAKLLVRYVVDKSVVDKLDSAVKTPDSQTDNLINSEVEILTSWDLATQVAETVGVERLLQQCGGQGTKANAARHILRGLTVTALKGTDIISVSYKNTDPKLAVPVLQELVKRYFDKHLEVHRSMGAFDFAKNETQKVRAQLDQTKEKLKQLKDGAGIISLAENTATLNAELAKGKDELHAAEAELAAQQALVKETEKGLVGSAAKQLQNAGHEASSEAVRKYQNFGGRVAYLRQMETEMLSKYTPENRMVKVKQAQIEALEKQRRELEREFPSLAVTGAASSEDPRTGLVTERTRLAAIEAKTEILKSRLSSIQARAKTLSDLEPQIAELERRKELEETSYKYFEASLEKARIDETLNPSRMPNISVVQTPSPAVQANRDLKKVVLGLAGGGLAVGIAITLLKELVLDRTVKRPLELETRLSLPLLLSIPYFGRNGHLRLRLHNADKDSATSLQSAHTNMEPSENGHCIRPFCKALGDRLAFYFELNQMTHKPKLVAMTGLSKGAGTSTLAAGLADTLSEGGGGKVLLVDKQLDPKRFYDSIRGFKSSDFDYVIFDMPSLSETSPTLAMAGFVDKVLLVVEAEKSNRDLVKRAYAQLAATKARVSVVFNKSRSYGPKWLEAEL
jgi:uncharacterized protein involved in exopolysaccharide biosynthesis